MHGDSDDKGTSLAIKASGGYTLPTLSQSQTSPQSFDSQWVPLHHSAFAVLATQHPTPSTFTHSSCTQTICLHPLQSHLDHFGSLTYEQPSQWSDITTANHVHTINNPEWLESLDDYLNTIHTNIISKSLQWLKSSPTLIPDNPHERAQLSQLYTKSTIKGSSSTFQEWT